MARIIQPALDLGSTMISDIAKAFDPSPWVAGVVEVDTTNAASPIIVMSLEYEGAGRSGVPREE